MSRVRSSTLSDSLILYFGKYYGKFRQRNLLYKESCFFRDTNWRGFYSEDKELYYNRLLNESEFRLRAILEEDKTYLQVIPQVILRHEGKYFLHRQVKRNEARLNSLCPLFLGGHVAEVELDKNSSEDYIQQALNREIAEEVTMNAKIINKTFLGLIYLDDNEVNSVHIGVAYIFDVDGEDVKVREEGLETIGWVDKKYLQEHIEELTYWSRIVVDSLE
ncbi:hypothetical protein IT418_03650 [bacterium]|nr:hypothetical protein [bacterium]